MSMMSPNFVDLPPEILERIFINLAEDDPDHNPLPTFNSLMRTCKKFNIFVNNSSALWKEAAHKKTRMFHWESELRYAMVT